LSDVDQNRSILDDQLEDIEKELAKMWEQEEKDARIKEEKKEDKQDKKALKQEKEKKIKH